MPRRAGKAASRRARQRSAKRSARGAAARPAPQPTETAAVPPVGTPDAREAEALDPPRRPLQPTEVVGDSRLSGRERAEYHYVERDLRSIGILTALMAVLLLVAWIAFSALRVTG